MCYEDIKLGARRTYRQTSNPNSIPAEGRRVVLRASTNVGSGAAGSTSFSTGNNSANNCVMCINGAQPNAEITYETHGILVQEAFNVTAGLAYNLIEILDDNIDRPPGKER
jgi:hypothetical protein